MKKDITLLRFEKDYKIFKKGQYFEVPNKRYTGQIYLHFIWGEIDALILDGILEIV